MTQKTCLSMLLLCILSTPTEKSAALYEQYLTDAGNEDFKIVVIPGVGHSILLSTPGYWDALSDWLDHLH